MFGVARGPCTLPDETVLDRTSPSQSRPKCLVALKALLCRCASPLAHGWDRPKQGFGGPLMPGLQAHGGQLWKGRSIGERPPRSFYYGYLRRCMPSTPKVGSGKHFGTPFVFLAGRGHLIQGMKIVFTVMPSMGTHQRPGIGGASDSNGTCSYSRSDWLVGDGWVREALGAGGAYDHCVWEFLGIGRYTFTGYGIDS